MNELLAALIGAVAATIGTVIWETHLRPVQQRTRSASVLRIEVAANRQQLIAISDFLGEHADTLPPDIDFEWATFNALASTLGTLKLEELMPTMQMYYQVRYLAQLADWYRQEWEHTRVETVGEQRRADAETRLHNIRASFRQSLVVALESADTAFSRLDSIPKERLGAPRLAVEAYERYRQAKLKDEQRS
jgi:hypothetical protein